MSIKPKQVIAKIFAIKLIQTFFFEFKAPATINSQNDRTLLAQIELERSQHHQLQLKYDNLLTQIESLQQKSHLLDVQELRGRKSDTELRALQKALVIKSEECALAVREMHQFQARYAKESTGN